MENDRNRIPNHLRGPKRGLKTDSIGNITVEDLVWIGPNGEVDPDVILKKHGYDAVDPLTSVLKAIIKGNPIEGKDDTERLEIALEALIGTRRKRGMDELNSDYELLVEIAHRFFRAFHQNNHREPDLAPIIREVIAPISGRDRRKLADEVSVLRHLRGKFNMNKDLLLARVSSEQDWNRHDFGRTVDTILQNLEALGTSIDRS